ncbi:MAG: HAD-IIIC family phosphatase [Vicinamibacterales bacterium]
MTFLRHPGSPGDAWRALDAEPSPARYLALARTLAADPGERLPLRAALLASFTIQPLVPYLTVELARRELALVEHVGPFNAVVPELVTPASGTVEHGSDVVVVFQTLDDVAPALARDFWQLSAADQAALAERVTADLVGAIRQYRQGSTAPVVLMSFWPPPRAGDGTTFILEPDGRHAAARRLNVALAEAAAALRDVYVLDVERVVAEIGARSWWDDRSWHMARAPLASSALPVVAARLAALIAAIRRPPRKCLVVDLDDTLWGGVLGEVGPLGIQIGPEFPGSVFRDFQRLLRGLRHRGVLLAVNSKNDLDDVREAFATNPHMVLRLEDFAAVKANWRPKPDNMRELAGELGIGLDSLVFVDDNPVEQALMREAVPQVLTLDLPAQPIAFAEVLDSCGAFDQVRVTDEDRRRTEMYLAQGQRRELEARALNLDDFLAGLRMTVEVAPVADRTRERAVELLRKTNQFNVTTRRHSAAEVDRLMADPAWALFTVQVADRFGDNGIVGLTIARDRGDGAGEIDTLLLSCRVIGRKVETVLLSVLVDWARGRGLRVLRGQFVPTARNAPAADCYERHGFLPVADADGQWWELPLAPDAVSVPDYLSISVGQGR